MIVTHTENYDEARSIGETHLVHVIGIEQVKCQGLEYFGKILSCLGTGLEILDKIPLGNLSEKSDLKRRSFMDLNRRLC